MSKIIISYRRSDSDAIAGRIRDRLASHFGAESLFMDIDNIPFGTDFREHIKGALIESDVVIVVIGPKWLGPGRGGRLRIKDETDPVRIEVETALQKGIPLIPVLVDGARMPAPSELPETLHDFTYRNAATVETGRDFHPHMDRLIRTLDQMVAPASGSPAVAPADNAASGVAATVAAPSPPARSNRTLVMIAAGGLAVLALILGIRFFVLRERPASVVTDTSSSTSPTSGCSSSTTAAPLDAASVPAAGAPLRDAILNAITIFFRCGSMPFDQLARTFASLSIVVPEYVSDAKCFGDDPRFLVEKWDEQKEWADRQGREDLLWVALSKAVTNALGCIDAKQQPLFYQDIAVAFTAATSTTVAQTFVDPTLAGKHIDRCLFYARECNEPAGFAWCKRFGFTRMLKWEWKYQNPTYTLGDRKTCGSGCGAFSTITCVR